MRFVTGMMTAIVVLVAGAAGFIYSGWYYVGADHKDGAFTHWLLHATMERSVDRRESEVGPVPDLADPALIRTGAEHYREMCLQCHLAPGVRSTEIRQGLNPRPPKLADTVGGMSDRRLFWIVKHGVRMTGMPAWGITHPDHKLWAIVAFLKVLPTTSPARFEELSGASKAAEHAHE